MASVLIALIVAVAVTTIVCTAMWHDHMERRNFVEHGYQQTTIVGCGYTVWQKIPSP